MSQSRRWSNLVVIAAVLLTGFGAAHLIDDFLYDIPADFGLSNEFSQVLVIVYFIITSLLLVLAARGSKAGYIGNLGLGLFLLVGICSSTAAKVSLQARGVAGCSRGAWPSA